ncbi:MAG: NAD(P)-dependent alcohol dehydrogenase [Cyclobacteriaceae bacterium]|nr:NAD(P)-dependent alcohol dehydrogenase [Cyclobacteriaceae bacterium]
MKAITYNQYGGPEVLQLSEIEKPVPKNDEVLIRVHAASLNALDWRMMRASPFLIRFIQGFFRPKPGRVGADVAGVVEAVGPKVHKLKPGDEVFGEAIKNKRYGTCAEYVCTDEGSLALKPKALSFSVAATLPVAGITSLQGLRDNGQIRAGQNVLIHGASGGVGSFAVQIAKAYGTEVTAVCSTAKTEMVRSIGADHIIDYKKEDFTQKDKKYDLIYAANGNRSVFEYKNALTSSGIYACAGGSMRQLFQAMLIGYLLSQKRGKKMCSVSAQMNTKDLEFLGQLAAEGKLTPVIDRAYPLEETKAAMQYLDEGHVAGKVVILGV